MKSLLNEYTDIEFSKIVENSKSLRDVAQKLGYTSFSGDSSQNIKRRIEELNLSTSHFSNNNRVKRNEQNIFIENSTADQATLRQWYLKGEYTEYKCSVCGQKPYWQNKPLTLILDHINGDNRDDRLENLRWVCPNCNQQLDTTNGKNRKTLSKKYYCIDCGKEISKDAIRCIACNNKNRTITLNEMPVSREELKDLIRTTPFTKIGIKFNVTDNAIRKWCDKFDLPRRVSDIKKYSDDEWSRI